MISKEQFLELKHLKSLGVPTTTIAKKIGISVPNANKWLRMDEDAFENYLINNTPYLEQYRAFILNILKICPQTQATNIMYRVKDQFPDFNCRKTTFFRYIHGLREQTGYVKPEERPTSFREETPPGYEAQVDFGQFKMKDMYDRYVRVYFFCMVLSYSSDLCTSAGSHSGQRRRLRHTITPFASSAEERRRSCMIRTKCSSSASTTAILFWYRSLKHSFGKPVSASSFARKAIRRPKAKWNLSSTTSKRVSCEEDSIPASIRSTARRWNGWTRSATARRTAAPEKRQGNSSAKNPNIWKRCRPRTLKWRSAPFRTSLR